MPGNNEVIGANATHPRLRDHLSKVEASDDLIFIRGAGTFVRFAGEDVPLLNDVIERLDGETTPKEIIAQVDGSPDDVREILNLLGQRGCLEDAKHGKAQPTTGANGYLDSSVSLYGQVVRDKHEPLRRLRQKDIAVVGANPVSAMAARSLISEGVRSVQVLGDTNEEGPRLGASISPGGGTLKEVERGLTNYAKEVPGPETQVTVSSESLDDIESPTLEDLFEDHDHVAVGATQPRYPLFRSINEASLETGGVWTSAYLEGNKGFVGPTVVPGETACYTCMELRRLGTQTNLDQVGIYERFAEDLSQPDPGHLTSFASVLAGHLATEVITNLTGVSKPALVGTLMTTRFLEMESETHRVLKMPRCPDCGNARFSEFDRLRLDVM